MSNKLKLCNPNEYYTSIKNYLEYFVNDYLNLENVNVDDDIKARRIDFTQDIHYTDSATVNAAVALLGCSPLSSRCHWKENNYTTSLFDINGSYNLNFYNKSEEREHKGEFKEAELTEGILRLEVQCKFKKLYGLKKSTSPDRKNTFLFYCEEPFDVIEKCFKNNFNTGNWYTLDKAIFKIRKNFSPIKADRMIYWLKEINSGNLKSRRKKYEYLLSPDSGEIKPSTLKGYIKDLEKVGISIFTLPDSLSKKIGTYKLSNPYQTIK